MIDIVLINPRFSPSYWGMNYALPFLGAKSELIKQMLAERAGLTDSSPSPTAASLVSSRTEPLYADGRVD